MSKFEQACLFKLKGYGLFITQFFHSPVHQRLCASDMEGGDIFIPLLMVAFITTMPSPSHAHDNAYRAKILRIIDGDTFEADIKIFINLTARYHIRIADIDTPEINHSQCALERQAGKQAKIRLAELLPINSIVTLAELKFDSFGRVVSHVHDDVLGNIGALLLVENHAHPYDASIKNFWCR